MQLYTIFFMFSCGPKEGVTEQLIVPKKEEEAVVNVTGPTETKGVLSVEQIGQINLQREYRNLEESLVLRARKLVIDSGGVVAEHVHQSRPGYAYILEGEITEYRNDQNEPLIRRTGDISYEATGVTHYWQNESSMPVEALVIDILNSEEELPIPSERTPRLQGPTQNIGIESIQILGQVSLGDEFPAFEGKQLRSRLFSLQPDAVIGQHIHHERSGFVYVLSGEILEYRNDSEEAILHQAGNLIVEENGVEHYWENKSGTDVKLLSFDIFTIPVEEPQK